MPKTDDEPALVLASQSPRRVELLKLLGLEFETIPSDIDETTERTDPADVVLFLATEKARFVARQLEQRGERNRLVLGADTIVVLGREILGKPSSRDNAHDMLTRMSGQVHEVFTGVAIVDLRSGALQASYERSQVSFRELDSAEISAYVATSEPMDKAGAYAVQGMASAFIEKIEGCYTNIIGLPTPLTVKMLRRLGVRILGLPS